MVPCCFHHNNENNLINWNKKKYLKYKHTSCSHLNMQSCDSESFNLCFDVRNFSLVCMMSNLFTNMIRDLIVDGINDVVIDPIIVCLVEEVFV